MTEKQFAALQASLGALFKDGIATDVGNGVTRDGKGVRVQVKAQPGDWNADTLRRTLELGLARWHGQHLNDVSVKDGAKLAALREAIEQAAKGETPEIFTGKRRRGAGGAGLDTTEERAVSLFMADLLKRIGAGLGMTPDDIKARADSKAGVASGRDRIAAAIMAHEQLAAFRPYVVKVADVWTFTSPAKLWAAMPDAVKTQWHALAVEAIAGEAAALEAAAGLNFDLTGLVPPTK